MPVLAFDALAWHGAPMPGSNGPVELARLPQLDDQAFRAFVRFPAGWARPGAGHYAVAEEFLILAGDLSLNGITWKSGGYAWIPARRVRTGSSSAGGCLAFAWFGGAPRWVAGAAATPALDTGVHFAHWRAAPETGPGMHLLRAGPEHSTWIVEAQPAVLPEAAQEALCLQDQAWSWREPADCATHIAGTLMVRQRPAFAAEPRQQVPG